MFWKAIVGLIALGYVIIAIELIVLLFVVLEGGLD